MNHPKRRRIFIGAAATILLAGIVGCASIGAGPSDRPLYYGYGSGAAAISALNSAKQQILRQVVPDLVGPPSASANGDALERGLYATDSVNAYFFLDTMQTISQGRSGDEYYYQIGIRVNLTALARSLRSLGVYGGQVTPSDRDELALPDQPAPPPVSRQAQATASGTSGSGTSTSQAAGARAGDQQQAALSGLTAEERSIVDDYIGSLTFMMYFDESAPEDPFIKKAAVGMANGYLTETGRTAVDLDTVERIKADQELVYEEQTGRGVSLIQWVAQKLNADVYAEIDARTSAELSNGNYYAQANLTMKFFESSTGTLLASVNYKSPRTFSRSSTTDAVNNALQSSVYQVMPIAMDQLEGALRVQAAKGIPYRLTMQNTQDARLMRDFMRRLQTRTKDVETVSQSSDETIYTVFLIGEPEDLLDIVFDVADGIPAFSGIELVLLRGRSLTFDTGM